MPNRGPADTSPGGRMPRGRCMNVKVDADLVRKAKVVAAVKNITLSRYITDLLRSHVENDLALVAAALAEPLAAEATSRTSNCETEFG